MFNCDCYWIDEIPGQGAREYFCNRNRVGVYCPDCSGCRDYINYRVVAKMVRSIADLLRDDMGLHLNEVEHEW